MTLKISTVEQTADSTSARGGKGNSELVMWDFGREITLNLQDALFSTKSMAIMFGDADGASASASASGSVLRTWNLTKLGTLSAAPTQLDLGLGKKHTVSSSAVYYTATGASSSVWSASAVYITDEVTTKDHTEIVINAETFPGTYACIGDTYCRSEDTGNDSFFQIQIPKAKMLSDVTLTMEAEGDPAVFDMQMKVLRPKNGEMMKLVKYNI